MKPLALMAATLPRDMHMSCRFSEAGRAELAAQLDEMLSGRQTSFSFSFSTSDPPQENAMTRECVMRDREGVLKQSRSNLRPPQEAGAR